MLLVDRWSRGEKFDKLAQPRCVWSEASFRLQSELHPGFLHMVQDLSPALRRASFRSAIDR